MFPLQADFSEKDTYYIFNHVDIVIQYHSGANEDWGVSLGAAGGRLVSAKLEPRRWVLQETKTSPVSLFVGIEATRILFRQTAPCLFCAEMQKKALLASFLLRPLHVLFVLKSTHTAVLADATKNAGVSFPWASCF